MPGSPTAQGERILGAGSRGRVPPPGWGMLQNWVRGLAPAHPTSGAQWDRHLPATQQNPLLASKGKKAPLMRLLKSRLWGQQGASGVPAGLPSLPTSHCSPGRRCGLINVDK